jgi:cell division protein FtsQ
VLGLTAVAAAAWLIGWSDITAVDEADVSGATGRLERAVRDAASVPIGMPLIRVDTEAIAERVREVPDVADVEVRRGWPQAVEIDVTLRTAFATIDDGDVWWSVDREGVLFADSPSRDLALVELIADTGSEVASVSARVAALDVVAGMPADLAALLRAVEAPSEASIALVLSDARRVLWGTASDGERKGEVLRVVMAEVPNAARYDVSAPDFPTATPQ